MSLLTARNEAISADLREQRWGRPIYDDFQGLRPGAIAKLEEELKERYSASSKHIHRRGAAAESNREGKGHRRRVKQQFKIKLVLMEVKAKSITIASSAPAAMHNKPRCEDRGRTLPIKEGLSAFVRSLSQVWHQNCLYGCRYVVIRPAAL